MSDPSTEPPECDWALDENFNLTQDEGYEAMRQYRSVMERGQIYPPPGEPFSEQIIEAVMSAAQAAVTLRARKGNADE